MSPKIDGTKPNFDLLAPLYCWMEWFSFGPFLMRTRCALLPQLASAKRALILGDGDGRFTARLLKTNHRLHAHAVDLSPRMLATLTRRVADNGQQLSTEIADLRVWTPATVEANQQKYDLVITHFLLDCLTESEIESLIARIQPALSSNAVWLVSEFAIPAENRALAFFTRLLIGFLYRAFALLTGLAIRNLPEYSRLLSKAGFQRIVERRLLFGILCAELWSSSENC